MTTSEVYDKYEVPQNLREHMYRVAAVGLAIVELLKPEVALDKEIITQTLLLHDIGNLIKFDLDKDELLPVEERERLKKVQADFKAKYGNEEHVATQKIAAELGVPEKVQDILNNIGSSKVHLTIESDDWYRKVCSYADFRVAPHGIVSINERWDDVIKRYQGRDHVLADIEKCEEKRKNCLILEQQIQNKCHDSLERIGDKSIREEIFRLPGYQI